MNEKIYQERKEKLLRSFVNEAIHSGYWIYQSYNKMWYTPEEFYNKYSSTNVDLENGWIDKFKIMNPLLGLKAADTMISQITERKIGFQEKIIDYYQSKIK